MKKPKGTLMLPQSMNSSLEPIQQISNVFFSLKKGEIEGCSSTVLMD